MKTAMSRGKDKNMFGINIDITSFFFGVLIAGIICLVLVIKDDEYKL